MRKKILIVDDEIDFTFVTKLTLESTGRYQVRAINMAAQTLPVAREFKPDLILLDCMMPGTDGGQVAAALQADAELRTVPFVFLTATVSEPETAPSRCYSGMQSYWPKTMGLSELVDAIDRAVVGDEGVRG